ncbi:MAG: glycoside hydrolase family 31 protein [Lewinella sp.]|nr:glycoside hydrolase family 31 protein [Lewinella sp.]
MCFPNRFLLPALLLTLLFAACRPSSRDYVFEDQVLMLPHGAGEYRISAVSEEVIRVTYADSSLAAPQVLAPVQAGAVPVELEDQGDRLILSTASVRVEISRSPLRLEFFDPDTGLKLSEEAGWVRRADTTAFRFALREGEHIYGTGFRATGLDRRGQAFDHYNQPHYGYGYGAASLNYSVPVWLSSENYMVLVDNPAKGYFDIGHRESEVLEFGALGGNQTYYFVNGDNPAELLDHYTQLTGRQPLPPIWAFGNLQSRFGYRSQAETEAIVEQVLAAGYPIDAVIIDLYWFSKDARDGLLGNLSWDTDTWPDPEGMIRRFAEKGIRTITVSEPFFVNTSRHFDYLSEHKLLGTDADGNTLIISDFFFGPAGLIDIFKPEARDWFWQHYRRHHDMGVAGWWGDLGEPEKHPDTMYHVNGQATQVHGLYGHEWVRMIYEGYRENYPEERFFKLARAGYAGTQRYGIIPWTGDVGRSWSGLRAQLPALLGMGLSGLGYMHSDAGGFSMAPSVDTALYRRWMQFAVFTPIFRPHGDAGVAPPEPALWDAETQRILKPFVELRYRLLPYIYTLAFENAEHGWPFMRPLFFHYPEAARCDTIEQTYLFGRDLLVAPILTPNLKERRVYLPPGEWYNYWSGDLLQGEQLVTLRVAEEYIPLFARAGSVLPMAPVHGNTSQYRSDSLQLYYYLPSGAQTDRTYVYFDDGQTPEANNRMNFQQLFIASNNQATALTFLVQIAGAQYAGAPDQRHLDWTLIGLSGEPAAVTVNGEAVPAEWDEDTRQLRFSVPEMGAEDVKIRIAK